MYPRVETPQVVFVEWPTEVHEEWTTLRHAVKRKARAFGYDNKTLRHFLAKFEKYNLMDVPATPKEFMFVRNLRRLLPNLSMDKLAALIKSFYEDKMERVEEYLEAWGLISSLSNHSFTQNLKVVVA